MNNKLREIVTKLNVARSVNCSEEKSEEIKKIIYELLPYCELEEELGIDLITLFEALNNPIYIKENYDGTIVNKTLWCSNALICGVGLPIIKVGDYAVYTREYGKMWELDMNG